MKEEKKLVRQAKHGDVDAFAKLYETVYQDMYRYAFYILKNEEDAKDAVSDAVTDAFASIRSLRREEAFRSWIFRILTNKCNQVMRRYCRQESELTEQAADSGAMEKSYAPDLAEAAAIRSMFFALPSETRKVIAMHVFGGYSSRESAQLLGMNENTFRSKESRAMKLLAKQLTS